jgi:ketosteroid isomerase-like protein
MGSNAEVI